jgi:hypothetical protein
MATPVSTNAVHDRATPRVSSDSGSRARTTDRVSPVTTGV